MLSAALSALALKIGSSRPGLKSKPLEVEDN